jgi:hypothetical protein
VLHLSLLVLHFAALSLSSAPHHFQLWRSVHEHTGSACNMLSNQLYDYRVSIYNL